MHVYRYIARLLTSVKCLIMLMKWSSEIKNFFTYLNNKCDGCLLPYPTLQHILMALYHASKRAMKTS